MIDKHIIPASASVREALLRLNALSGESMTLFAVTPEGELVGTLTDGDIRRALIAGVAIDEPVDKVVFRNFLAATPETDLADVIARGRKRRIDLLPVTDGQRLTDILDLRKIRTSLPLDAVLMAGGRGERLRPLTDKTPKPLLPVGGKAIIDYNIEELEACGVERIFVTVNYLAEQIEAHFAERDNRAVIECVREPVRLGTMGSLSLIDNLSKNDVLLMNSDLLTSLDFEKLHLTHRKTDADITIAAVPYNVSVPFALMNLDGNRVTALQEKPTFNYFANAGVYLIKRSLLSRLGKGEYMDAPDFISSVIEQGGNVRCHPIDGTWIDIGSQNDYKYANELMGRKINL